MDITPAKHPAGVTLNGRLVRLTPLHPARHGDALWEEVQDRDDLWAFLFEGPFPSQAAFATHLHSRAASPGAVCLAIEDRVSGRALGYACYMRIEPAHKVIEVGSILYSPALQRTAAGTEAMYLMARHAFEDLGYRRYEWKCNALNAPSRRAALRYGFTFEGIFRQHMIVKGQNRDTAWFAMLDGEWPERKAAFERWLHPDNFDSEGQQIQRLQMKIPRTHE